MKRLAKDSPQDRGTKRICVVSNFNANEPGKNCTRTVLFASNCCKTQEDIDCFPLEYEEEKETHFLGTLVQRRVKTLVKTNQTYARTKSSKAWMFLPPAIRPDFNSLFKCLLSSRADSTVKKYLKEIIKFLLWCRTRKIALQSPFSSSVVALYLFGLDQQLRCPAAMVLVHAALKWFHSFVPDDGPNPLD